MLLNHPDFGKDAKIYAVQGRFITLEGGEGGGKSSLTKALADALTKQGIAVHTTREPGSGTLGAKLRQILLDEDAICAKSELFLFLADRAQHVEEVILPALKEGKLVLCDRYIDSTFVYQVVCRGLDAHSVEDANRFATGGLVPDLTLLLDIDPAIGLNRVKEPNRIDLESLEFHQKVRQGFLDLAQIEAGRIKTIDASLPMDQVLAKALDLLSAGQ